MLSSPRRSSSSDMRSKVTSPSSALASDVEEAIMGTASDFRLVDFNVFLKRMDEIFLEILGSNGLLRDLAQRHDRVLVVVAVDRE